VRQKFDDEHTYAVIGAAMTVHAELGFGFLEGVYREALALEFRFRGIPFDSEVALTVAYRGIQLLTRYRVDFLCYDSVVVEVKAMPEIAAAHQRQVVNYLKAARRTKGLLFNFGTPSLDFRRIEFGGPLDTRTPSPES
jgi:GxxExxY protein